MMNNLSKGFSPFKGVAKIEKNVDFNNLRNTYITWMNVAMGKDTMFLTGHADNAVIEANYLDPKSNRIIR